MKGINLINAIASGHIGNIENEHKIATGKKFVITWFLDHLKAETMGLFDNPDVEVLFADTDYYKAITEMASDSTRGNE